MYSSNITLASMNAITSISTPILSSSLIDSSNINSSSITTGVISSQGGLRLGGAANEMANITKSIYLFASCSRIGNISYNAGDSIELDTVEFDQFGIWDTSNLKGNVKLTGRYLITMNTTIVINQKYNNKIDVLTKNKNFSLVPLRVGANKLCTGTIVLYLESGDELSLRAYDSCSLMGSQTFLTVTYLG
jgi:hypothetical protein